MRTIVEAARTMLQAKDLKKELWAEAVNTAVYVLNRTSASKVKDKTLYELYTGRKFDIKNLQIFGSEVYVHVPKQQRKKWDTKGEKAIFVGYGENIKGYRIYFPERKAIDTKRDVIFITGGKQSNGKEKEGEKRIDFINDSIDLGDVVENVSHVNHGTEPEQNENEITVRNLPEGILQEGAVQEQEQESEGGEESGEHVLVEQRQQREVKRPAWLLDYEIDYIAIGNEPRDLTEAMES